MIIGVGLYLVFLDSTESDVLLNFSSGSLENIVGSLAADIITYCVLLGYASESDLHISHDQLGLARGRLC